ncbi:helicase-associated domain-containing protein [Actinorugispora endophytica]|uniref:XPB/Ssl2-like helicase family protein n=1 Tax=Actinorugispora endophytica TaxID=1605990 RepID=A0A4V3D9D7_9ACTN|nr:helicase-associated domain-containing protein [Actinorugispora endophytica]TDQ55150.1 XPB/Ssl2-like helicase family protein [Actinorugispora endophytica]
MSDDAEPVARRDPERAPTYTSWLRGLSDTELGALFIVRPDLVNPVPAGIAALAARATAKPTVVRALDRLDRFSLQVLEGLLALGDPLFSGPPAGTDRAALAAALDVRGPLLDTTLDRLRTAALVWDDGGTLRPISVLRGILDRPAGLGPPLVALLSVQSLERLNRLAADLGLSAGYADGDPAARIASELTRRSRLDALLAEAGESARPVLDRLVWGPSHGSVTNARREVSLASAASPIDRLLALGLIVATDEHTVALPREVALHLRGGRLFSRTASIPPRLDGPAHDLASAGRAAAGQAFTVVRVVEELLEDWAGNPPGVLRNGGLGVRDLRRAARTLDTDEPTAAVLLEITYAAGLIAADGEVDGEWLPTGEYDIWRAHGPARRWVWLAEAWLRSPRVASLSGQKDARGRARNVLGEGLERRSAPETRLDVLRALARASEATAPTPEAVAEYLAWLRPRRQGTAFADLVRGTLDEAATLGLTGRGVLVPYARALLPERNAGAAAPTGAEGAAAASLLASQLPEPLDHFLLQGDLTAVAPGPLLPPLARELALAADVESTGGATVYRFSAASVRRALDAGRGADELVGLLERHSTTPVPQPLRYLVTDVARRHGRLRVGTASSYLRCDDPAVLDELLSDRRAADLLLFPLAPTVIASRLNRPVLLDRLTELGYHAVPEATDGTMQLNRPETRRAAARASVSELAEPDPPGPELRAAAVRAIRAGDEAATAVRHPIDSPDAEQPRSPVAATTAALAAAAAEGRRVWIGYLDTEGIAGSSIVEPAKVDGGFLTAYDTTRAAVRRFAVHRITGVASLGGEPASS